MESATLSGHRLMQFVMALRDEFEGLRGSILHCTPFPSVYYVVNELSGKGLLPPPTQNSFSYAA